MDPLETSSTHSSQQSESRSNAIQEADYFPQPPARAQVSPTISSSTSSIRELGSTPSTPGSPYDESMRYAPFPGYTPPLSPNAQSSSSTPPRTPSDTQWNSPALTEKLWDWYPTSPNMSEEDFQDRSVQRRWSAYEGTQPVGTKNSSKVSLSLKPAAGSIFMDKMELRQSARLHSYHESKEWYKGQSLDAEGIIVPSLGYADANHQTPGSSSLFSSSSSKASVHSNDIKSRLPWQSRIKKYMQAHFAIVSEPQTVMPYPPDNREKLLYLDTKRSVLLVMGVFSFLSASAGVWLFTVSSSIFAWFSIFATFVQVHLTIFYFTGVFGKDFDYKKHVEIKETFAVSPDSCPSVDIYLPCCKEPLEILRNTYKYVAELEYPASRLKVHVLDDGASDEVKFLAESFGFNYMLRDNRPELKKAGNLRWAFARTEGDFFVIYDADFCPRSDFLLELIPRMKEDPRVAILQTPQYFRATSEQTWVERGAGSLQEIFYRFIQTNRDKWGSSVCVGSNAVYRREALKGCGGVAGLASSEDIHTGIYAISQGWRVMYAPLCLAAGVCPDQARAFFSQQVRWCEGSTSLVFDRTFWKNALSKKQKVCYLSGLLYYVASALGIFINPLPVLLLLWFKIDYLNYYTLLMALPSIVYGIVAFRLWSRTTHSLAVQHIDVIQQYAYLSAMVDVVFGTSFNWVPSGEGKAHKSNRYRNYRLVAIAWNISYQALFISAVAYRMVLGHTWYHFIPLIILDAFSVYVALPFLIAKDY